MTEQGAVPIITRSTAENCHNNSVNMYWWFPPSQSSVTPNSEASYGTDVTLAFKSLESFLFLSSHLLTF